MGLLQLLVFREEPDPNWLGSLLERPREVPPMVLAPALWDRGEGELRGAERASATHRTRGHSLAWAGEAGRLPEPLHQPFQGQAEEGQANKSL